jgi:desulfoferrodoxin (superoxide reductase-like protein)
MNSDAMTVIIGEVLTSISESHGITWVVVTFGILERISIRSHVFATVGTVERPFPAKTYHYHHLLHLANKTLYCYSSLKFISPLLNR